MLNLQSQKLGLPKVEEQNSRLMLFDLSIYGHHPGYIQYLLSYWHQEQIAGQIIVLVSPQFLIEHADVVELGKNLDPDNIQFIAISQEEEDGLKPRNNGLNRNWRNFQEWFIFCRYARQLRIDHALLMYYDTYQYPLALRLNPLCGVSGVYFRPTFHYKYFSNPPANYSNMKARWEQFILKRVLSNSGLHHLLTIDPLVVQYLEQDKKHCKLKDLADPVQLYQYSPDKLNSIKASLGIDPHRQLFLLFGALTGRKGIYQLLESIQFLSEDICNKIAIALIGESSNDNQNRIETQIAEIGRHYPIQIYRRYEFLPEEEIQAYFEISDFILALYQNHVGMSGILNHAAVKQKPVLSSDYGLMGELVRQYDLGLTVDSTDPKAIALAIEAALNFTASNEALAKSQQFAERNTAFNFAQTIFHQLLPVSKRTK